MAPCDPGEAVFPPAALPLARFPALATMLMCGLSALAVLWVAFPAAVLPPCAA